MNEGVQILKKRLPADLKLSDKSLNGGVIENELWREGHGFDPGNCRPLKCQTEEQEEDIVW